MPLHRRAMRRKIGAHIADIAPVIVRDVAVNRFARLNERGEEIMPEVVSAIVRNERKRLRLENINAGVDCVGHCVAARGLFIKRADFAVLNDIFDVLYTVRDGKIIYKA